MILTIDPLRASYTGLKKLCFANGGGKWKKMAQFQTRWVKAEILAQNRNNGTKVTDFIKQQKARRYPECQYMPAELNPARGASLDSNRLPSNKM